MSNETTSETTPMSQRTILAITIAIVVVLSITGFVLWRVVINSEGGLGTTATTTPDGSNPFGALAENVVVDNATGEPLGGVGGAIQAPGAESPIAINSIAQGPVAGATIVQTRQSTSSISSVARYLLQENGHVYDSPLDTPGGTPRPVSNTTIPGVQRVFWVEGGQGALIQYLEDNNTIKTAYLGFPRAQTGTTTLTRERVQFLPDNVRDIAVSPSGKNIIYLTTGTKGANGYLAQSDGSSVKLLFTMPFSQILIHWPSTTTAMIQTKASSGAVGAVFSVNTTNGVVVPLMTGTSLTATVNKNFSRIVYSTAQSGSDVLAVYARDVALGNNATFGSTFLPEKCAWSNVSANALYCARPFGNALGAYLDWWHLGNTIDTDYIAVADATNGSVLGVAVPGSKQGGKKGLIMDIVPAANDKYLLYTQKGERSLWSVTFK